MMAMLALLHAAHPADAGPTSISDAFLHHWSIEPGVALCIAIPAILYARGTRALWRSAGIGRGVKTLSVFAFASGMLALAIALLSPVDAVADSLMSAHMVQHLILILVAPPLLIAGNPFRVLVWSMPKEWRLGWITRFVKSRVVCAVAAAVTAPLVAFTLHASALLVWHMPTAYDAAVASETIHGLEHLTFFGTALLYWWVVMAPQPFRQISRLAGIPYVVAMSVIGGAIGAVLTFASAPLYSSYALTAPVFGMSQLDDQQLAGLIMWIPGSVLYLIAASLVFVEMLNRASREAMAVRKFNVLGETL
jgi:putative membrane protein